MSKKANPRLIGLFVLGAVALLVAALAVFGGGRLFARTETFVMFFEDDVGGLDVGAPVTFRGVRIGSVTNIQIRYDTDTRDVTIPVLVKLEKRQTALAGSAGWESIDQLVARGLRAQLKMQSFVTGQVSIELDFDPGSPRRFVGVVKDYPEIPTKRSSISQFRATFSDLIAEIRKLPIDQLIEKITTVSENMSALLGHVDALVIDVNAHVNTSFEQVPALMTETRRMVADFDATARDLGKLTRDLDANAPAIGKGTADAIARLNTTLEQAQTSLVSIQDNLGDRSPLQFQMTQTLTEITAAASAMRVLAEYLQENPAALLSGKGAQPK